MSNQVRVIDNISGETLFQTTIEKIGDAYSFAEQMEEIGLDLRIEAPGLAETLIRSLGAKEEEIANFKQGLDEEIEDHDQDLGCAVCIAPGPHK